MMGPADQRLRETYFLAPNGEPDDLALTLDCSNAQLYFALLRRHPGGHRGVATAFLQSFVLCIVEDPRGRLLHVGPLSSTSRVCGQQPTFDALEAFQLRERTIQGAHGLHEIEAILDGGAVVSVSVRDELLPYFISYQRPGSSHPLARPPAVKHHFLLVGHDTEDLFYVDTPGYLRVAAYIPHPLHDGIGLAKKSIFQNALRQDASYFTVEVNDRVFARFAREERLIAFLRRTCREMSGGNEQVGQRRVTWGEPANQRIEGLLAGPAAALFEPLPEESYYGARHLCALFDWKFLELQNKRRLLWLALREYPGLLGPQQQYLEDVVFRTVGLWATVAKRVCVDPDVVDPTLAADLARLLKEAFAEDRQLVEIATGLVPESC